MPFKVKKLEPEAQKTQFQLQSAHRRRLLVVLLKRAEWPLAVAQKRFALPEPPGRGDRESHVLVRGELWRLGMKAFKKLTAGLAQQL